MTPDEIFDSDAIMEANGKCGHLPMERLHPFVNAIIAATKDIHPEGPSEAGSKCARCHKDYKKASSVGCPRCAPNVEIGEDEFRQQCIDMHLLAAAGVSTAAWNTWLSAVAPLPDDESA